VPPWQQQPPRQQPLTVSRYGDLEDPLDQEKELREIMGGVNAQLLTANMMPEFMIQSSTNANLCAGVLTPGVKDKMQEHELSFPTTE